MASEIDTHVDPLSIITPLLEANITPVSVWAILLGDRHASLDTGCLAEYNPVEDTSRAHTPSDENAYRGN